MKSFPRLAGFTLLEVLVVMVLIGIILGFVTLSVGSRGDNLEREARRLQALLGLAREQAIINYQQIGLQIKTDGYVFLVQGEENWQPLETDGPLRARRLPPGMALAFSLDHTETVSGDDAQPRVALLSSGEITPFSCRFYDRETDGPAYFLRALPNGEIELETASR